MCPLQAHSPHTVLTHACCTIVVEATLLLASFLGHVWHNLKGPSNLSIVYVGEGCGWGRGEVGEGCGLGGGGWGSAQLRCKLRTH